MVDMETAALVAILLCCVGGLILARKNGKK